MSPTNDLNAGLNYAFLNDEELQVLKKAESDINNSRTEKVFLIGFSKANEGKTTGAKA
ncbi:MAG: hypothetical protein ACOYEH_08380 [Caldicoprobacterales bacterium]|jgi:hypothetical protein|nr:hypothetical protein [Clostridiales bacterium]